MRLHDWSITRLDEPVRSHLFGECPIELGVTTPLRNTRPANKVMYSAGPYHSPLALRQNSNDAHDVTGTLRWRASSRVDRLHDHLQVPSVHASTYHPTRGKHARSDLDLVVIHTHFPTRHTAHNDIMTSEKMYSRNTHVIHALCASLAIFSYFFCCLSVGLQILR